MIIIGELTAWVHFVLEVLWLNAFSFIFFITTHFVCVHALMLKYILWIMQFHVSAKLCGFWCSQPRPCPLLHFEFFLNRFAVWRRRTFMEFKPYANYQLGARNGIEGTQRAFWPGQSQGHRTTWRQRCSRAWAPVPPTSGVLG